MQSPKGWLLRGLAVAALTAIVALWVLVQPLSETPPPTLTPTATPTLPPTSVPTLTSTPTTTPTLTPTPTPTHTPTPTLTPAPSGAKAPTATREAGTTPGTATTEESPITSAGVELAGRVEQYVYFSPTSGGEEPYRIYLPPDYDQTDQRYPVLYLFHGWPYEAAHWDVLGTEETADAGIQSGILPPFIVVQPRGSERMYINTCGGDHSFEGQIVNDLIPHVDATYRTQAEREGRAIGGISRGGVWALEISFYHPDIFAAVGAHSPALSANLAPTPYDPFYLLKGPGVATLRIYLDAGDSDWALESTQALHETLDEQAIAHEFVVHPGRHASWLWAGNVAEYLAFYAAGWSASP